MQTLCWGKKLASCMLAQASAHWSSFRFMMSLHAPLSRIAWVCTSKFFPLERIYIFPCKNSRFGSLQNFSWKLELVLLSAPLLHLEVYVYAEGQHGILPSNRSTFVSRWHWHTNTPAFCTDATAQCLETPLCRLKTPRTLRNAFRCTPGLYSTWQWHASITLLFAS